MFANCVRMGKISMLVVNMCWEDKIAWKLVNEMKPCVLISLSGQDSPPLEFLGHKQSPTLLSAIPCKRE